jgi:hypothetical protein
VVNVVAVDVSGEMVDVVVTVETRVVESLFCDVTLDIWHEILDIRRKLNPMYKFILKIISFFN